MKPFGWRPEKPIPPEPKPEWPAPEVSCRPATEDEIPKGARSIIKLAEANDWFISRKTYAKGTSPTGGLQWLLGEPVGSFVLGVSKGDLKVAACWVGGSFSFAFVRSSERKAATSVNSLELRAVLKGELN